MTSFKTRIEKISKIKGKVILANDYEGNTKNLHKKTLNNIKKLHPYLCGIKLNFHLLLPLGTKEIQSINQLAKKSNLVTIADIKLNDIGNTNQITLQNLWKLGFDAVIVNPIMGKESLRKIITESHKKEKGVITLCHMSAKEARLNYEMKVQNGKTKTELYKLFLNLAIKEKADGIIVGATFPSIVKNCKKQTKNKLKIY